MEENAELQGLGRSEFLKAAALAVAGVGLASLAKPVAVMAGPETKESGRWGFLIDLRKCTGCQACAVACKTEFDVRLGVFRSSVKSLESGVFPQTRRNFLPWLCNHCAKPACLSQCPVDEVEATFNGVKFKKRATYQRPDGVVLVDQDRCIGCGACVELCPYKVRYLDPIKKAGGDPSSNPADKCTLCHHRLDEGVVPSCVNTCPAEARVAGNLDDADSEISKLIREHRAQPLLPENGTDPRSYYIPSGNGADDFAGIWKNGQDARKEA